jgi:arylsulfatase A-like enzyme
MIVRFGWIGLVVAGCEPDEGSDVVDDSTTESDSVPDTDTDSGGPPGGNVLILLADDMGVDKVKAYGITATNLHTPNVDALAASGMRFDNAWATPLCASTRAALQTGRHVRRTGHGGNASTTTKPTELDPGQTTLAEVTALSSMFTYDLSYVGKWHLSTYESPSNTLGPTIQGWKYFAGSLGNLSMWEGPEPEGKPGYFLWQKVDTTGAYKANDTYATIDTTDEAIARFGVLTEPWVMQVAYNAAHAPFELPPAELITGELASDGDTRKIQRQIVEALDTEIGRLLAALPEDVRSRTTIVFLGDNGTGSVASEPEIDENRAKGSVYEPGVRVPFIVQGPLVAVPGSVSTALVSVVDVWPTLVDIVGADVSGLTAVLDPNVPLAIDGESLLPLFADPTLPTGREILYAEQFSPLGPGPYHRDLRAVRDDKYKLVYDAIFDEEQFFEFTPGDTDEGLDLLPCPMTAEQQAAHTRLRARMDELVASMVFDAIWTGDDEGELTDGVPALLPNISCAGGG